MLPTPVAGFCGGGRIELVRSQDEAWTRIGQGRLPSCLNDETTL